MKEWQAEQAADVLVDPEPFSVPSSATEEPELSEEEQEAIHRSLEAQQRCPQWGRVRAAGRSPSRP
jgi:hypothetical protein